MVTGGAEGVAAVCAAYGGAATLPNDAEPPMIVAPDGYAPEADEG